jgi:argininosuccinate lyase
MTENGKTTDETSVVRRDRFTGGPAREFMSSLAADKRIFSADIAVDRAHTVMLAEQEIIEDDTGRAILSGLESIESDGHGALPDGEDVHEAIETELIDRIGSLGGKMHTARSRNDEVATCIRYRLRTDILGVVEDVLATHDVLIETASANVETIMPGYTHLQLAQPTTVGHFLLSYASALERDIERLLAAFERTNVSPLGAAAFAGTPFDINRERTAELLGFDEVLSNAMDASASRDFLVETVNAITTLATGMSGLAEDLVLFASRGHLILGDDYASTSSIMPQKVNPDTIELVRAVAGDMIGEQSAIQAGLKGLPRAYNRDLQRVTPHAWRAVDTVSEAIKIVGGAIEDAEWDGDALGKAAGEGFGTATGVADALATAGVPFRQAHEVVAKASAAAKGDRPSVDQIEDIASSILDEPLFERVSKEMIEDALDPVENVKNRDSYGGPAPSTVQAELDARSTAHETYQQMVISNRTSIEQAASNLEMEVDKYV